MANPIGTEVFAMRCDKRVVVYCQDAAFGAYLRRALERCGEIEVVSAPAAQVDAEVVVEDCLSVRERECLQAVADCGDARCAAQRSGVSVRTVHNTLASVRAKLGVGTTLEAVVWALRRGAVRGVLGLD